MGFKSVYRCLQEVFPEMDVRILKAVAIEHSKDADAAVNDILTEVLPYMTRQSSVRAISPNVEIEENRSPQQPHLAAKVSEAGPSSEPRSTICDIAEDSARTNGALHVDITHLNEEDDAGSSSERKCTAVEHAENSGLANGVTHAEFTHLDQVVDTGLASEPRFTDGENVEDNSRTYGFFHTDTLEPICKAVENAEISGSTNGWSHSDLTHLDEVVEAWPPSELSSTSVENAIISDLSYATFHVDLTPLDEVVNEFKVSGSHVSNDIDNQVDGNTMNEELILLGKTCETKDVVELCQSSTSPLHEKDGRLNGPDHEWKIFDSSMAHKVDQVTHRRSCESDTGVDGSTECNPPSEFDFDPPVGTHKELQASGSLNLTLRTDCSVGEMGTIEDDFTRNSIVTQSGQICRIDILDEIIEDAKNNKKILFYAMESVINLMKEVELQERAAEQAKEEAAKGGLDILTQVEELKQMLGHAKETNDMHAGEVYGEKAILATEMKELQSRLLCLSDERDKSVATLDEMRQTLEARLAAAEELKKAAEQEKLEKEESARSALAEQEAIMEKVVQESRLLEKEAEENSKLREFLVDRGRMMDMLQGEISVICQDVGLLKEKFDKRLPLSMSVSSSQTSCKLASSSSSVKSMASVSVPGERESPRSPEKSSPVSPTSDRSRAEEDNMVKSNDNELLEDGWDIFDKDAELEVEAAIYRE